MINLIINIQSSTNQLLEEDCMEKYELKFMYDWGSGVCVWSVNAAAKAKFNNYPIKTTDLPISQKLANLLINNFVQNLARITKFPFFLIFFECALFRLQLPPGLAPQARYPCAALPSAPSSCAGWVVLATGRALSCPAVPAPYYN